MYVYIYIIAYRRFFNVPILGYLGYRACLWHSIKPATLPRSHGASSQRGVQKSRESPAPASAKPKMPLLSSPWSSAAPGFPPRPHLQPPPRRTLPATSPARAAALPQPRGESCPPSGLGRAAPHSGQRREGRRHCPPTHSKPPPTPAFVSAATAASPAPCAPPRPPPPPRGARRGGGRRGDWRRAAGGAAIGGWRRLAGRAPRRAAAPHKKEPGSGPPPFFVRRALEQPRSAPGLQSPHRRRHELQHQELLVPPHVRRGQPP